MVFVGLIVGSSIVYDAYVEPILLQTGGVLFPHNERYATLKSAYMQNAFRTWPPYCCIYGNLSAFSPRLG